MDTKALLEQLLQSGQTLLDKGRDIAEEKLNIPAEGEQRDAMLDGMKKGAVAAGALALLLGTRGGRAVTGTALKLGSVAALGGLAWKAYQEWAQGSDQTPAAPGKPLDQLEGDALNRRSAQIIRAMIAAAKADGHIDEDEKKRIDQQIAEMNLVDGATDFIARELDKPLNIHDVVEGVDDPEAAVEIYLASRMVVDVDNIPERIYLKSLARELKLSDELVARLDKVVQSG